MTASQGVNNQEPENRRYTLEEYFEFQKTAERRYEYHDGKIIPVTSATENHGKIVSNLVYLLQSCLRNTDCDVYASDREVYVEACHRVFYPDLTIICGKKERLQYSENVVATLNPTILIEVLSDSTQKFDRTTKMNCYRKIDSLRQYVLLSQDEKFIEILERDSKEDKSWTTHFYEEGDDIVKIGDCEILLGEIYHKVELAKGESKSDN